MSGYIFELKALEQCWGVVPEDLKDKWEADTETLTEREQLMEALNAPEMSGPSVECGCSPGYHGARWSDIMGDELGTRAREDVMMYFGGNLTGSLSRMAW